MKILEQYDKGFRYVAALSYLLLANKYFMLWAFPDQQDAENILTYSTLMALEFILVHSGIFMLLVSGNKYALVLFVIIYGLFALGINFMTPNYTVLTVYLFVVFNRMKSIFYEKSDALKTQLFIYSGKVLLIYFVLIFLFVLLAPLIPVFGLTREYIDNSGYRSLTKATGMLMEKPQVALSFGFVYFLILGFLEFRTLWVKKTVKVN